MAVPASTTDQAHARVLVVDDEESITQLVSTVLRYEGFEVRDRRRAAAPRSRSPATFAPDLVVLDVMLPDLDGFEVYRRLADRPRPVPVLFLTARDATEDRVHGLTLGADDYVGKPFSLEELVARVRAVLRRTRGGASDGDRCCATPTCELDEDAHEVRRGGPPDRADADRVQPAALPAGQRRPGGQQGPDPRPRLALRLRRRLQRGRDVHQLPAQEGRRRRRGTPLIQTVRGFGYALASAAGVDVSLRFRLTAISVLLVALGLLGAGVATRHYLDSFLVDRVDQQFAAAGRRRLATPGDDGAQRGLANALPGGLVRRAGHARDGVVGAGYVGTGTTDSDSQFLEHGPRGHLDQRRLPRPVGRRDVTVAPPGSIAGGLGTLVIAVPLRRRAQRPCSG